MHNVCYGTVNLKSILYFFSFFSTWDEYAAEVKSGRLEWSPVHKQEKFWVSFCDLLVIT